MEIREKTIFFLLVGVILTITWGVGTALLVVSQKAWVVTLFLYIFGSIGTFIFLNLEYRWIRVK